ncbi:hypothetical protein TrLO_g13986 [Triparma laevis f. longispina]|uniref:Uncharacterized protein n=1 Tax=Triparma laevis f. longispina TaxID=1714387 RepID=A0A9W7F5Q4_9STRA|nr:hypothetical protein TrLO_g13986 [Triparma laevis f. longispina]
MNHDWDENADYSHALGVTLLKFVRGLWNHYFQQLFGPYSYITWVISNQTRHKTLNLHFEPQRHYHTLVHIYELLDKLSLTTPSTTSSKTKAELFFIAVFHDCVYDPTLSKGQNETQSNDHFKIFTSLLSANSTLPPSTAASIATIEETILCTISHKTESSNPTVRRFLNADINVLAKPLRCYRAYAHLIRLEYIHVSRADYLKGRVAVLKSFLSRPELFFKVDGEEGEINKKEKQARENIEWEIQLLKTKGVIPGEENKGGNGIVNDRSLTILTLVVLCVAVGYALSRKN